MQKTILITGSTDGIGFETAKSLISEGHQVILHGRNPAKLENVVNELSALAEGKHIESYVADFSDLKDVESLSTDFLNKHDKLDVLINNAGVFKTKSPIASNGLDVRFVVNTLSPYLLTKKLLPILGNEGRVVNLSSAAQAPIDIEAFQGNTDLDDMSAYAQSKLAITMWTAHMAQGLGNSGPMIVAVNPASLLGSKMVKEGFGTDGNDLAIGVDILKRAALSQEFADASGKYYDNDIQQFSQPHPAGRSLEKTEKLISIIETLIL